MDVVLRLDWKVKGYRPRYHRKNGGNEFTADKVSIQVAKDMNPDSKTP